MKNEENKHPVMSCEELEKAQSKETTCEPKETCEEYLKRTFNLGYASIKYSREEITRALNNIMAENHMVKSLSFSDSESKAPKMVMDDKELHNVAGADKLEASATIDVNGTLELIPEEQIRKYLESKRKEKDNENLIEKVAIKYYQRRKKLLVNALYGANNVYGTNCSDNQMSLVDCLALFKNCDIRIIKELNELYNQSEASSRHAEYQRGFSDALDPKRGCGGQEGY